MSLVIAAGCPKSGWEMVIPILSQMGIQSISDGQMHLLKDLLKENDFSPHILKEVDSLLKNSPSDPVLLADGKNLELLDFWANRYSDSKFLLFFVGAEFAIANAIMNGDDLQFSLDHWKQTNGALLRFNQHNRSRTILLDAQAFVRHPEELVLICKERGLQLSIPDSISSVVFPSLSFEQLLAAYWLSAQPNVQDLESELEASSYPISHFPLNRLAISDLLSDYNRLMARSCDGGKDKDGVHGLEALLKDECDDLKQENAMILLQLHQLQERYESLLMKLQQQTGNSLRLQMQCEQLECRLAQTNKELEKREFGLAAIKSSTSWRYSLPIRLAARVLGRGDKAVLKRQIAALKKSGFFNELWYFAQYPDVKEDGIDPVEHYICYGAAEGRDPSPEFNTNKYLSMNPDVAADGINPLLHFIEYGMAEGRKKSP